MTDVVAKKCSSTTVEKITAVLCFFFVCVREGLKGGSSSTKRIPQVYGLEASVILKTWDVSDSHLFYNLNYLHTYLLPSICSCSSVLI